MGTTALKFVYYSCEFVVNGFLKSLKPLHVLRAWIAMLRAPKMFTPSISCGVRDVGRTLGSRV
jgi:hypothetical protein